MRIEESKVTKDMWFALDRNSNIIQVKFGKIKIMRWMRHHQAIMDSKMER